LVLVQLGLHLQGQRMPEVNSALAALVTQAPDDDELPAKEQQAATRSLSNPEKPRKAQGERSQIQTLEASPDLQSASQTAKAPSASSKSEGSWLWRCYNNFRRPKEKKTRQGSLSAVVPTPESTEKPPSEKAQKGDEEGKSESGKGTKVDNGNKQRSSKSSDDGRRSQSQASGKGTISSSSTAAAVLLVQKGAERAEQKQDTNGIEEGSEAQRQAEPASPTSPKNRTREYDEKPQLGPQAGPNTGRKTLVLDLDETLVHSSFRVVQNADIVISVEIEGENHAVYVRKRPGCDEFLVRVAELYEVVIYTASMSKYASPLLDELDKSGVCHWRLYREACTRLTQGYVKDLSRLGRDLRSVIIIDNSPICYSLQPDNAIPIQTWRDDIHDRELLDLIPILISLAEVDDIPQVLRQIIWSADDEALDENG